MGFVKEKVKPEEWEFFNSLNINYKGEKIVADKYTEWVIEREKNIIFTNIDWGSIDFPDIYVLIWEGIYRESLEL